MREMFVSKEIAYKLLEKGFDENCLAMYNDRYWKGDLVAIGQHEGSGISGDKNSEFKSQRDYYKIATAPTHQQVTDWFRDKHDKVILVKKDWDKGKFLGWECVIEEKDGFTDWGTHKTYYEALNKAIEEALKLI